MIQSPSKRRFGGGATLVAAGIFLSRIAGVARTVVIGVVLGGNSAVTDAFGFLTFLGIATLMLDRLV